ncbi:hypothetical protein BJV74DRAFT_953770 [Russula compacta]|nr:hypothetical protein BJV74DRAFT_953770 [Russula compacta]
MISFMQWSFMEYERSAPGSGVTPLWVRVSSWLRDTALFEQAWTIVCDGPLRWWWSEQLCLFTVGFWTIFLLTKGREYNVKHVWAYMLLGQLVAISVAANLFFLALPPAAAATAENSKKPAERGAAAVSAKRTRTVPPVLWLSVLASLATVFLVPHSLRHDYFLSNLLVMHALLVIPLLLPLPLPVSATRISGPPLHLHIQTRTLYRLVALLGIIARLRTTLSMDIGVVGAPGTLWAVLKSHPAQASIGWDVVWTTISFLMWVRVGTGIGGQLTVILNTVIGSIGTSAPVYMTMNK